MVATIIRFLLSNYALSLSLIGFACAILSIFRHGSSPTRAVAFENFLAFYCLFPIGVQFLYNFVMHVFFSKLAAQFIGWETSPFQQEVGFASLGFGVVGLLAFRGDFGLRVAAVTGPALFFWGAAGGHIYQMVAHHNFSPGNAGVVLWTDILLPIVGFCLLAGAWNTTRQSLELREKNR